MVKILERINYLLVIVCSFSILFTACQSEKVEQVSLSEKEVIAAYPVNEVNGIKIAVSAIISPKKTFIYYKELLDYISKKINTPVKLVQRETYIEINDLIRDGEIQVAFVCSGAYIDGYDDSDMELLVVPKAYGQAYYYSYVIVPVDSDIKDFKSLRGKRFAFTDPMSNTGKLVPTYMLSKMGETPDTFFGKHIFTYSHDKSIEAVAQHLVDGASVDSLVWDYANATNPTYTSRTKIISKSPPYGIPPVVVPKGLDPELKESLKNIFLNMHLHEESSRLLKKLHIDSFIEVGDDLYDSIREMRKGVAQLNK